MVTAKGWSLVEQAAPRHVADVRDALVAHLTPREIELLTVVGDKVRDRLAELQCKS